MNEQVRERLAETAWRAHFRHIVAGKSWADCDAKDEWRALVDAVVAELPGAGATEYRLKHLQPAQLAGMLRRADGASSNPDEFLPWNRMPRDMRAALTAAIEVRDLLAHVAQQKETDRLALEIAVDACWSVIDSNALTEMDGETAWLSINPTLDLSDEFRLLVELKLAEMHPQHPSWIREIAEL